MKKNNEKEVRGRAKHGKRSTRQGRVNKNGKKGTKITKKRYEAGPRTEKEVRGRAACFSECGRGAQIPAPAE